MKRNNRFLIIGIAVALLLCAVPTALSLSGCSDPARSGVNIIAVPFRAVFNWIGDGIEGFGKYFSGMKKLSEENERLRAELEASRKDAARADLAEGENERLREELGFASNRSELDLTDANIVGRSSNGYSVTYTLDRGTECGIAPGMAVITPGGICGYIREAGAGWSRFVALTDPTSSVGAITSSGIYCSVTGSVDYRPEGLCVVSGHDLPIGTMLYSSGFGGIYPSGLPIGKVVSTERDGYSHSVVCAVEPTVDPGGLTGVLVVRSVTVLPKESGETELPDVPEEAGGGENG